MATPRTPCHLTMQARSLRVPDSCDDHTTPSGLVVNSLAESRYWSMHTLALPDPSVTQWGLVTFLACALHQLFVRSCDLAHHPLYCSHVCASTHRNSLQHLPHLCLSWLSFSSQLEEQQNMRLPHGTTWWNTSYWVFRSPHHTLSNSYKLVRALRPPVQILASTREPFWYSDSKLCVLPTGYTQCHQSTGSDGLHSHRHK